MRGFTIDMCLTKLVGLEITLTPLWTLCLFLLSLFNYSLSKRYNELYKSRSSLSIFISLSLTSSLWSIWVFNLYSITSSSSSFSSLITSYFLKGLKTILLSLIGCTDFLSSNNIYFSLIDSSLFCLKIFIISRLSSSSSSFLLSVPYF